jgi:PST family polysaccharide transporter
MGASSSAMMHATESSPEGIDVPQAERTVSRVAWIIGEQVIRLGMGLLIGVWMARLLGPQDFGRLNYAMSVAAILGIAATLGFNRVLVREMVACRDDRPKVRALLESAIAMRLVAGVVLNMAGAALSLLMPDESADLRAILTLSLLFNAFDCIDLYYQAKLGTTHVVKARLAAFTAVSIVRLLFLIVGASVQIFAALYLLEAVLSALVILRCLRQDEANFSFAHARLSLGLGLLKESWPEVIAGFSGLLFMRMDQVMLQHLSGPDSVGYFAAAARFSELWYFIPSGIVAATYPGILACKDGSEADYLKRLRRLMARLVALSYVAILMATCFGDVAVGLVYGERYRQAAGILVIHIWCGTFVVLAMVSGMWIMAEKLVLRNMVRNVFGALLNLLLNWFLIPRYGAIGAAYATLLAFVFAYFVYDFIDPRMRKMAWMKVQSMLLVGVLSK